MQSNDLNGHQNFVQHVPDHCDRIVWRNAYYHLQVNQAPAVPDGWKLAPVEPTNAMLGALVRRDCATQWEWSATDSASARHGGAA